jgi:hypothetical protein
MGSWNNGLLMPAIYPNNLEHERNRWQPRVRSVAVTTRRLFAQFFKLELHIAPALSMGWGLERMEQVFSLAPAAA